MKVKLVRNTFIDGKHCKVGETVEVKNQLGAELIGMNKAVAFDEKKAKKTAPQNRDNDDQSALTTRNAGSTVPNNKKK